MAVCCYFFFFNDTPTTGIYTLSLHDALPISGSVTVITYSSRLPFWATVKRSLTRTFWVCGAPERSKYGQLILEVSTTSRSEEHTSELQSQSNLVCRLLLEKKKIKLNKRTSRE